MIVDNISWGQFAEYAGIGLCIYYVYIILTGKVKITFFNSRQPQNPPETIPSHQSKAIWRRDVVESSVNDEPLAMPPPIPVSYSDPDSAETEEQDQCFEALQMLANDIQDIIADTVNIPTKEMLVERLGMEVNRYPILNQPALRSAIGNIIIKAAKVDRETEITKAETEALWGQPLE